MIHLDININFGPAGVWWALALLTGFLCYVTWRVAWVACEHHNQRQVEKRMSWMVRGPHLSPDEPITLLRVSRYIANIPRRWGLREDGA